MPFDQFTVEQLAGDLLPGATLDQRIATGFNRNHRGNAEGGIIPEEYAVEYVVDRVETTSTVWLGLTMGCARCHDHKFDPITQKEFYQFFAYFNNVPEKGRAIKYGNSPPVIEAPTPAHAVSSSPPWIGDLAEAERAYRSLEPTIAEGQRHWEKTVRGGCLPRGHPRPNLATYLSLDGEGDKGLKSKGGRPAFAPVGSARPRTSTASVTSKRRRGDFGFCDKFSWARWVLPRRPTGRSSPAWPRSRARLGYGLALEGGRVQVHLTARWLDDAPARGNGAGADAGPVAPPVRHLRRLAPGQRRAHLH